MQHVVISEYFGESIAFPFRAALQGKYKYVNFPGENGEERLTDIAEDYNELENLINDPAVSEDKKLLSAALDQQFHYPSFKEKILENQADRRLLRELYVSHRPDWDCKPDYPARDMYIRGG